MMVIVPIAAAVISAAAAIVGDADIRAVIVSRAIGIAGTVITARISVIAAGCTACESEHREGQSK